MPYMCKALDKSQLFDFKILYSGNSKNADMKGHLLKWEFLWPSTPFACVFAQACAHFPTFLMLGKVRIESCPNLVAFINHIKII